MRPTCTDCALKHISQSMILLSEAHQGYPMHLFYSLGHLAEASDELVQLYPEQAAMVREERKKLEENPDYSPRYEMMLDAVAENCDICQLEPDLPPRGTGRVLGVAKEPTGVSDRLSEAEREVRHNPDREYKPYAWTKCELRYPSVRRKIAACAKKIEERQVCPPSEWGTRPDCVNPYAVCRAAIKCPPQSNPIAWTECELDYPSVQDKILSCAAQLTGVPGIESPIAVCRASIPCPPR